MKKLFRKIRKPFENILNNMRFKHKFFVLYFSCVIVPLVITDSLILKTVFDQERNSVNYDMEYVARVYENYFDNLINNDITLANSINMNKKINEVLDTRYSGTYDYFTALYSLINDSLLETTTGLTRNSIVIYSDNKTILNGHFIKPLSGERNSKWYRDLTEHEGKDYLDIYFDESIKINQASQRKFQYIKVLDYYKDYKEKILVISHDTATLERDLRKLYSGYPVYITSGDYVIFSTEDNSVTNVKDLNLPESKYSKVTRTLYTTGSQINIIVVNNTPIIRTVFKNNVGILLLLLLITIIIPPLILRTIENSIIKRISRLENAFGNEYTNTFKPINEIEGNDEIAFLMRKYNKMVDITNELVTTVYKDKIKEQESDIARQKAELLALQSQINPHFMFNALESIRMHSLLKGETETASMVDKLAVMERQNVEWGKDFVTVKKEIESIEAYLALQSYRFGDRLSFNIEIEEGCENYLVPKLTIVTFVENACVHGIESKATQGWIFVRVYKGKEELFIEIEDTGEGMTDEKVSDMLKDISEASIETIKNKKHVGILNACLRLKMVTDHKVKFEIESEPGIGLSFIIKIPFDKLKKSEDGE